MRFSWFVLARCRDVGAGPVSARPELTLAGGERTQAYPSDLSDEQWAAIGPFLAAWKAKHPSMSGHQGRYELREIMSAIQNVDYPQVR